MLWHIQKVLAHYSFKTTKNYLNNHYINTGIINCVLTFYLMVMQIVCTNDAALSLPKKKKKKKIDAALLIWPLLI